MNLAAHRPGVLKPGQRDGSPSFQKSIVISSRGPET